MPFHTNSRVNFRVKFRVMVQPVKRFFRSRVTATALAPDLAQDTGLRPDCANCGAPFVPERRRFCPECGQETHLKPPTLFEFFQQFGGAYFATEGAFWRTFKLLFLRPGELTRQYLAGRRKHFLLPLRLYLSVSLVVLLAIRVLASDAVLVNGVNFDADPATGSFSVITLGDGSGAGMMDGKFFCNGLPQWLCQRLQRRLDVDAKGLQREVTQLSERFLANMGAAVFAMLPLFALWLKMVYWNRHMRYTEHLVFALHLHTFWFVAIAFMLSGQNVVIGLAFLAMPVYALMAMKRVYGDRWWARWLRAAVVSLLYLLTLSVVLVALGLWSLLF